MIPTYTRSSKEEIVSETSYHTSVANLSYINDYTMEYPEVLSQMQDGQVNNIMYGTSRIESDDRIYITDGYGNVVVDLSHEGGILEEYSYSDYGVRSIQYNPILKNSSYGYRSEAHTYENLQYLRARFYDTYSEVFIQQDEYKGEEINLLSKNRYLYVLNNPYKYSDPSGHMSIELDGSRSTGWSGGIYFINRVIDACLFYLGVVSRTNPSGGTGPYSDRGGMLRYTMHYFFNTNAVFNPVILEKVILSFNVDKNYERTSEETFCNFYVQDLIYAYGGGTVLFPAHRAIPTNSWLRGEQMEEERDKVSLSHFKYIDLSKFIVEKRWIDAKKNGWKEVDKTEVQKEVDSGKIVVLGHREAGHISLARPSDDGVFKHTQAGKSNAINSILEDHGLYKLTAGLEYHVWTR